MASKWQYEVILNTVQDAQGKFGLQPDKPKEIYKQPVEVAGLAGKTIVRLVSGADHVLALTSSGELLSWGCFEQGRYVCPVWLNLATEPLI